MTLQKLAELAHVSVSTASKAFSGSPDISEKTKQLVIKTAKKYNCFEQFDKGIYHKKIIAVICPELRGGYYSEYVTELERRIREMGSTMALSISHFDSGNANELFLYHSQYQKTDGIILIGSPDEIKNPNNFPAVALSHTAEENWLSVQNDLYPPIREAIFHLTSMGHKDIVFLGELKTEGKQKYYEQAMEEAGLTPRSVVTDARFEQCGYLGMSSLLSSLPTAVITAYDSVAIGAIHLLQSKGIRIPEEISVIGMDNISVTPYLSNPLTTISSCIPETCDKLLELLLKKMDQKHFTSNESIIIPGTLIHRSSVCKPRREKIPV